MSEYHHCVRDFADHVDRLRDLQGGEFNRTYRQSEAARLKCEEAGIALRRHVHEHGCGTEAEKVAKTGS